MTKYKMVTLDQYALSQIASRADIVSKFPFFADAAAPVANAGGCGGCTGTTAKSVSSHNRVLQLVHGLPAPDRAALKDLLQSEQVRIIYQNTAGATVSFTF